MNQRGFTLVELLIAAAIVAILAAVAAPLLLQSQARANLARVRADIWQLKIAGEAYHADCGAYMPDSVRINGLIIAPDMYGWTRLTTPVAYLASVPVSPFTEYKSPGRTPPYTGQDINPASYFEYYNGYFITSSGTYEQDDGASVTGLYWRGFSVGVDNVDNFHAAFAVTGAGFSSRDIANRNPRFVQILYDPSNGTISRGDLVFTNKGLVK